jgi:hypothetical protein
MAYADPAPAFRGYQDEVWELMRRGHGQSLGGIEDAIEQTEVSEDHKVALWLLAFSLSDEGGWQAPGPPISSDRSRRHLSLVPQPLEGGGD